MSEKSANYEFVVHPAHYNGHPSGLEAWDFSAWFPGDLCIAINYLWRGGLKPDNDYRQDLLKAASHIEHEIGLLQRFEWRYSEYPTNYPSSIQILAVIEPFTLNIQQAIDLIEKAVFSAMDIDAAILFLTGALRCVRDEAEQYE